MGDDVNAPHEYSFSLAEDSSLLEVFVHLEKKRYLAGVAGKNHSWDAIINKKQVAHFKGNSQKPEPNKFLNKPISKYSKSGQLNLGFIYNSANT
ncbi:hypothetical protein GCM10011365_18770 [Marinicella pacifica]|uniref:Uncharacterized protein n=2 Tax=Marinicella pacifica TaxID=1171543 RepID=A0A917FQF8_9GAMM|nr:hypothetical protein GCM10011365_18770 [Marinicella pacifica]